MRRLADNASETSIAHRLRVRRFEYFLCLARAIEGSYRILDVGGTVGFWERMGVLDRMDVEVVVQNVTLPKVARSHPKVRPVIGDARHMPEFATGEFDVVFSNSVIEHVGDFDDQRRMADEVRRVGRRFFVQTPNRWFPLEPHFLVPFFQHYPEWLKVSLIRNFDLGQFVRRATHEEALDLARSVQLLDREDLELLFPGATIWEERVAGLCKSLVAYDGWDREASILARSSSTRRLMASAAE